MDAGAPTDDDGPSGAPDDADDAAGADAASADAAGADAAAGTVANGAGSGPHPAPPSPDDATRARTLVAAQRLATLSTLRPDGHPFGSVVQYVADDTGAPVIFVSELAEHTRHLRPDVRARLVVPSRVAGAGDPMALPRACLVGRFAVCAEPAPRERFFDRHPTARAYADFADFRFWRLDVDSVRVIGGYGRMSWVDAPTFAGAEPDPLATDLAGIVDHMNGDHADACLAYAQALGGVPTATGARLVGVDRLGMDLVASTPTGIVTTRVNYPAPVTDAVAVRVAVVGMLRAIRGADGS
jgi:putative heme iron utilization protein